MITLIVKMMYLLLSALSILSFISLSGSTQLECPYAIVESMPDLLKFNNSINFKPRVTHETLIDIIQRSERYINIASFYWTLSAEDEFANHPSALPGKQIMDAIEDAVKRGVKLQVVLDQSTQRPMGNQKDIEKLISWGTVRYLNMTELLNAGVLHTKFLTADGLHLYVGSSNFDWRSYSQIKEIGIAFWNCFAVTSDLDKIFNTYVTISDLGRIPEVLPEELHTKINIEHPLAIKLGSLSAKLFLGASPPSFNEAKHWIGRTDDIDGLLKIIDEAEHFVDISVMNYSPRTAFSRPRKYWPRIDNALRRAAAERQIRVRLLFSDWDHTKEEDVMWYKSLNAVQSEALKGGSIHVKMFKVPKYDDFQKSIPYARVKHDKFMVTDNGLYIGTSNWAPDYFINTCGVSVVIRPQSDDLNGTVIHDMRDLFERDFLSEYSHEL